jgi:signal transduction histidine kinase
LTVKNPNANLRVPFSIHPRAFKALGADLVTNDIVAIIELVKNAYDAYATDVEIRFREGDDGEQVLEIEDNGCGMDLATLQGAWCVVATSYRQEHPVATLRGRPQRRTSGEKGLGRLSAARLGSNLEMLTQTSAGLCWRVTVDWEVLAKAVSMDECEVCIVQEATHHFNKSGTMIRIAPLRHRWDEAMFDDLRDNLARLLPPFETPENFTIRFGRPGLFENAFDVEPPAFLLEPKYVITGDAQVNGSVKYAYEYRAIKGSESRTSSGKLSWKQIREHAKEPSLQGMEQPHAGPFSFEIRAWDIAPNDTQEIADRFEIKKSSIRRDIKAYKGISLYRDGVLVLPKSEGARDWLGLDLRRVGRVGHRLSTTQIVGYVSVTADANPLLEDTSDRERLASTPAVIAFEETLRAIVSTMENEREKDRREATKERRITELFEKLTAKDLIAGVSEVAKEGGSASEALPLIEEFGEQLDQARHDIEARLVYYSRLASVGTIAHYLVHEVRNRTTVLDDVLSSVSKILQRVDNGAAINNKLERGEAALLALDTLADKFAPLANRQFRRRMRSACLEESILSCLVTLTRELKAGRIRTTPPTGNVTRVAIDPGELEIVLYNLLSNAIYWLTHGESKDRMINVTIDRIQGGKRVRVTIHDSGPGVPLDDVEKVFWPGVTNKPGGIGMGLTVASELVAEYGGQLGLMKKGQLGGASFFFDVPIKE